MKKTFVPVNEPIISKIESKYLLSCIKNKEISSSGKYVKEFEKKFAKRVNRKYAVAVSSGTAALQLAYECFNLKKGDEVILPAFTIISCILPIIRSGATPILVDSNIHTWNMDINQVKKSITKKTRAIIIPHIYGLTVDLDPIIKLCKNKRIRIIEDSAESLGLNYKKKPCGSFGDVSTFSFFANKHITTGEGGMITTNDKKIYENCKSLRNIFFNQKKRFVHYGLGWNYRLTNIQAALGIAQLKQLDKFVKIKRKIGNKYKLQLRNINHVLQPLKKLKYCENIYWVYGLVIKKESKLKLDKIRKELFKKGIETRNFFWPLNKQPILKKMGYFKNQKFPVAEFLGKNGFYIPTGLALTEKQQNYVIRNIKDILKNEPKK
jgi:perosamine synthetase